MKMSKVVDAFPTAKTNHTDVAEPKINASMSINKIWNVAEDALPVAPFHHPLQKMHVKIDMREATVGQIAGRISGALATLDFARVYENENANVCISTPDDVKFSAQPYKYPDGRTVVEARRWTGYGIAYKNYARIVLNAAQGLPVDVAGCRMIPVAFARAPGVGLTNKQSEEDNESLLCALNIAAKLMNGNKVDGQRLGVQLLQQLTQPGTVSAKTAVTTSAIIISGKSPHFYKEKSNHVVGDKSISGSEESPLVGLEIRESLLSILGGMERVMKEICNSEGRGRSNENVLWNDKNIGVCDFHNEDSMVLNKMATKVIKNACDVLEKNGVLKYHLDSDKSETFKIKMIHLILAFFKVFGYMLSMLHDTRSK